jgi:dihydrodipicolinate synthase/N-acetylneuraminate lyase
MSAKELSRKPLMGVFPLVPFAIKEDQSADYDALAENVDFLARSGVHGTVMFGCMGEFYAPSEAEYKNCVEVAVQAAAGRIAVVVGTTWQNTHECIRRTQLCERAGADGVMIAAPYTINPTRAAVLEHFRLANQAVDEIQIMVYNYPPLARGFNCTPEFWDDLLELEHVKALKESNGDTWHRTRIHNKLAGLINIFPGGEPWMFSDFLMGAKGVVSLFGIAIPQTVLAFYNALLAKDLEKALPLAYRFTELGTLITLENEVAALKATAEIGGHKAGRPRSPYQQLEPELWARFEKHLAILAQVVVTI